MAGKRVAILGIFAADLVCCADRLPAWGETVLGTSSRLGPGGKGSNQAVAAARLGAGVVFIAKLGRDMFGDMARALYVAEGIDQRHMQTSPDYPTGAAAIVVDPARGENAIVVVPGASEHLTAAELDAAEADIAASAIFLTQLELKLPIVERGIAIAARHRVPVILNPAPATTLPDRVYAATDYLTPNETEASALSGQPVDTIDQAAAAAEILLARGARNVLVTLGAKGVLVRNHNICEHIAAIDAGPAVDTTGAGDAFNAGLAVALAEGHGLVEAARFGCAVGSLSVTRAGTAPAMPRRTEVDALLASLRR